MGGETNSGPQIVVAFQGYTPPFDAEKAVRRMLRIVPTNYLWGLHNIVLTNTHALSRRERDRKTWGRRRVTLGQARGYYTAEWKREAAHITILIDNLERHMGRQWLRVGLVRDMELADVLFHELGHHIHRVHRPKYEEKEDVADKWRDKFARKFLQSRYWYLVPLAVPIVLVIDLSKWAAKLFRRLLKP